MRPMQSVFRSGLTGTAEIVTGAAILYGVAASNTDAANTATLTVWDGAENLGDVLAVTQVPAASDHAAPLPLFGVRAERGLTIVTSAALDVVIYFLRPIRDDPDL